MEDIIEAALNFVPAEKNELPVLYSFDIFDTQLCRSCHFPIGVFYFVQDKMKESDVRFSQYVMDNYFKIRPWAERDMREYYNKSKVYRNSDKNEVTVDLIFEHMQTVYELSDEQISLLKKWELEAEYGTSRPIVENIDMLKEHSENARLSIHPTGHRDFAVYADGA